MVCDALLHFEIVASKVGQGVKTKICYTDLGFY